MVKYVFEVIAGYCDTKYLVGADHWRSVLQKARKLLGKDGRIKKITCLGELTE